MKLLVVEEEVVVEWIEKWKVGQERVFCVFWILCRRC